MDELAVTSTLLWTENSEQESLLHRSVAIGTLHGLECAPSIRVGRCRCFASRPRRVRDKERAGEQAEEMCLGIDRRQRERLHGQRGVSASHQGGDSKVAANKGQTTSRRVGWARVGERTLRVRFPDPPQADGAETIHVAADRRVHLPEANWGW